MNNAENASLAAWAGHNRGTVEYKRILWALLGAGIATFAQLYSPQGILPALAKDLHVDAAQASLSVSAATIGLALSVLPWSLVADRMGRVPAMRLALITATGLGLVMPWMPTFEALMSIRVLEGIALGGIPAVAVTYLGEEIDRRHVAIAAGTYVSGTTIGGLLGRLVAAPIADFAGWRVGTFAVAIMAALASAIFFFVAPKPRGFRPRPVSVRSVLRATLRHMRDPKLLVLYAQGFLLMGGFVAVYNYLAFRLEGAPFYLQPVWASLIFLSYLAGTVSSRVAGGLVLRLGRRRVLVFSIVVMIVGLAITLANSIAVTFVGLIVMTAGFFGAHSIASGWSGVRAVQDRAQSASLYNFWYYAGSSVLGYLAGVVYISAGWYGLVGTVTVLGLIAGVWAFVATRE